MDSEIIMQIHHCLHPQHSLSLMEGGVGDIEDPTCHLCRCECYGPSYACLQCKFLLHKLCARLPAEIPCPSHPSQLLKRANQCRNFTCACAGICSSSASLGFPYRCDSCCLDLHFGCIFYREVDVDEGLYQMGLYDGIKCALCRKSCTGTVMASPDDDFFLHKSCGELPDRIHHPSHPCHPLGKVDSMLQYKCSSCVLDRNNTAGYCCIDPDSDCTYCLDVDCAFLYEGSQQLLHLDIHSHLLASAEKKLEDELSCIVCREFCCGPTYSCLICNFHLHKSCIASEEILNHPSHPFHPLNRMPERRKFKCHACLKECNSNPYHCKDCDFNLDFDCAFVVPREEFNAKELLPSNIHRHPFARTDMDGKEKDVCCSICGESCSFPVYSCGVCGIFVHKSCATVDLPQDIEHPLFQGHSLQLSFGKLTCSICLKERRAIHYGCSLHACKCKAKLDVGCALDVDRPLITFKGHNHPLIFLEKFDGYIKCSACSKYCDKSESIFHCPSCDFNLHLLCGSLPFSLQQKSHPDLLVLKDTHVDDQATDGFFCDSCEQPRDPRACVYYCARCYYSAEIKCVLPELLLALTGKCGDVELRTVGHWGLPGKVASRGLAMSAEEIQSYNVVREASENTAVTLGCILDSLTADEQKELDCIFDCKEMLLEDLIDTAADTCLGYDENFLQLVRKLESTGLTLLKKKWDADISFVPVENGDSLVPEKLVRVYDDLCRSQGDLGSGMALSPRLKSLFFLHLCQTIERMWVTTAVDVTEEDLLEWWISLKAVRRAGFKVQFAVDALKLALHTYYGTQAEIYEDKLEREIGQQEEKIQKMKKAQGAMEEELKRYKEYLESRASTTVKDCIKEATPLMYKTVSEVVFFWR